LSLRRHFECLETLVQRLGWQLGMMEQKLDAEFAPTQLLQECLVTCTMAMGAHRVPDLARRELTPMQMRRQA